MRTLLLAALSAIVLPAIALATDGSLEINQVCALQTGCFPGDTPGFPVQVVEPGSYHLTSNLDVPAPSVDGITVAADAVSIDLNGFSIRGLTSCSGSGSQISCSPIGSGDGIGLGPAGVVSMTEVRNGSISGMGQFGMILGPNARVDRVRVSSNGGGGIAVGTRSVIDSSVIHLNAGYGVGTSTQDRTSIGIRRSTISESRFGAINVGANAFVVDNQLLESGQSGILCGEGSTIQDNLVRDLGDGPGDAINCTARCKIVSNSVTNANQDAIRVGEQSLVTGNLVQGSVARGIHASTSALVIGNTVNGNGDDGILTGNASTIRDNTVNSNGQDGIDAGDGSSVAGNAARSNGGFGLRAESTLVGFSSNVFGNNNGGEANPQTSSGTDLGGNLCDAVQQCP